MSSLVMHGCPSRRILHCIACICSRRVNVGCSKRTNAKLSTSESSSFTRHYCSDWLLLSGRRPLCTVSNTECTALSESQFDIICNETLDSLAERFEDIADNLIERDFDVTFASGVVTVVMGADLGTYVINRQTPNRQIWLSSPVCGPKRYEFQDGAWIYRHDGVPLHQTLSLELSQMLGETISFADCLHSSSNS